MTGTSQPQALFVEPKIVASSEGEQVSLVLEEAYLINGVCRLVVVANSRWGSTIFIFARRDSSIQDQAAAEARVLRNPDGSFNIITDFPSEELTVLPTSLNQSDPYIVILALTIPEDSAGQRYGSSFFSTETYRYCQAITPESE